MSKNINDLMNSLGNSQSIRVVAKNFAKSIADQSNIAHSESNLKALEEAFVRGANWRMIQMKKNQEKELPNE